MCLHVVSEKRIRKAQEYPGVPEKAIRFWKVVEVYPSRNYFRVCSPYRCSFRWVTGENVPKRPLKATPKTTINGGVIHCWTTRSKAVQVCRQNNQAVIPVFVYPTNIVAWGMHEDVACKAVFVRESDYHAAAATVYAKLAAHERSVADFAARTAYKPSSTTGAFYWTAN